MSCGYVLVHNENGELCYDTDGDVLVERLADGVQFYVNTEMIQIDNELPEIAIGSSSDLPAMTTTHHKQDETTKIWTRNQILQLIQLFKENKHNFASTAIKNIKVWQNISKQIEGHSATQCENKFKYLKGKYLQKKDNMSNKNSGARQINFEFFEELEEIFGHEPIVAPLAIASSSQQNTSIASSSSQMPQQETDSNYSGARSKKTAKLKDELKVLNEILKQAEIDKQKRHEELITIQRENMNKFSNLIEKLIDKI